MRSYNYKLVKDLISSTTGVVDAELGMYEDWFWTAKAIYHDGVYISDNLQSEIHPTESYWATPALFLTLQDGTELMYDVSIGEKESDDNPVQYGVLSSAVQQNLPELQKPNLQ